MTLNQTFWTLAIVALLASSYVGSPSSNTDDHEPEKTIHLNEMVIETGAFIVETDTVVYASRDTMIRAEAIEIHGDLRVNRNSSTDAPSLYLYANKTINVKGTIWMSGGTDRPSIKGQNASHANSGGHGGGLVLVAKDLVDIHPEARVILGNGGHGGSAHAKGHSPLAVGGGGGDGGFLIIGAPEARMDGRITLGNGGSPGRAISETTHLSPSGGVPKQGGAYGGNGGNASSILAQNGTLTGESIEDRYEWQAVRLDIQDRVSRPWKWSAGNDPIQGIGNARVELEEFFNGSITGILLPERLTEDCQAPDGAPASSYGLDGSPGDMGEPGSPGLEGGNGALGGAGTKGEEPEPAYGGDGGDPAAGCDAGNGGDATADGGTGGRGGDGGEGGTGIWSGGTGGAGHFGMQGGGGGFAKGGAGGGGGCADRYNGDGGDATTKGGRGGGGGHGGDGGWAAMYPGGGGSGGGRGGGGAQGEAIAGKGHETGCNGKVYSGEDGASSESRGGPGSSGMHGNPGELCLFEDSIMEHLTCPPDLPNIRHDLVLS